MENIKFIFDKRKLDTLLRLGVTDSALLELLKTGKASKTGDALIDDYLKSVLTIKKFSYSWGGKRDGSGKKIIKSNTKAFHLEKQLEKQDESNLDNKDIDKEIDNIFSSSLSLSSSKAEKPKNGKSKANNIHPTFEDVKKYAIQKEREDLAENFYNYYQNSDWIDSKGNKVKNWKNKFAYWMGSNPKQEEPVLSEEQKKILEKRKADRAKADAFLFGGKR